MIKDTGEQPDEEVHRQGLEGSQARELLSWWSWGVLPTQHMGSLTRKLLESHILGIFVEASSHKHDWSLSQSPGPLPFLGERAESSKLLVMTLSFWWPAPVLKLSKSPPRVTPLNRRHSYHPGNSKGFRSSVSGTRVKDQILERKMLLLFLSLRKLQGSELCARNQGQRSVYIFSVISHWSLQRSHSLPRVTQLRGSRPGMWARPPGLGCRAVVCWLSREWASWGWACVSSTVPSPSVSHRCPFNICWIDELGLNPGSISSSLCEFGVFS